MAEPTPLDIHQIQFFLEIFRESRSQRVTVAAKRVSTSLTRMRAKTHRSAAFRFLNGTENYSLDRLQLLAHIKVNSLIGNCNVWQSERISDFYLILFYFVSFLDTIVDGRFGSVHHWMFFPFFYLLLWNEQRNTQHIRNASARNELLWKTVFTSASNRGVHSVRFTDTNTYGIYVQLAMKSKCVEKI